MPRRRLPVLAVLVFLAVASAPAAAEAATAPVAAYGFEDTGATTVVGDSSPHGNAGAVVGGATRVAGRFGSALAFDGVDDLVRIADAGPLNLASGLTVEAWVAPTATSGWRTVLFKGRRSDLSYALYAGAYPSGHISTRGVTGFARGPAQLPTDAWTHLAVTYDGTTSRLYVDGVQAAANTERSGPLTPGDGALTIGGNDLWGEWFAGRIDEVARVRPGAVGGGDRDRHGDAGRARRTPARPAVERDEVGTWRAPVDWPMVAVHASMLSNGKVAAWDAFDAALDSERIWDPETASFEPAPSGINLFCAGHVLLPDGRLFAAGGHKLAYEGLRDTRLLNPLAGSWAAGPDMARGRWYPTTTTLADGRVLIVSGDGDHDRRPEHAVHHAVGHDPGDLRPEDQHASRRCRAPRGGCRCTRSCSWRRTGASSTPAPTRRRASSTRDTGQWSTLASQSPIDGHSAVMYRPGKILKTGTWTDTGLPGDVPVDEPRGGARPRPGDAVVARGRPDEVGADLPHAHRAARRRRARARRPERSRTPNALAEQPRAAARDLGSGDRHVDADGLQRPAARLPQHVAAAARRTHPAGRQRPARRLADGQRDDRGDLLAAVPVQGPAARRSRRRRRRCSTARKLAVETPDADRIAKVSLVRMGAVTHNFNMDQRWQELSFRRSTAAARDRRPDVAERRAAGRLLRLPHRRQGRAVEGRDRQRLSRGRPRATSWRRRRPRACRRSPRPRACR